MNSFNSKKPLKGSYKKSMNRYDRFLICILIAFAITVVATGIIAYNIGKNSQPTKSTIELVDEMVADNYGQPVQTPAPVEEQKNDPPPVKVEKYVIRTSVLNIREEPNVKSKKVGEYYRNQVIDVIEKVGTPSDIPNSVWLKTAEGYISADFTMTLELHNEKIRKYSGETAPSRGGNVRRLIAPESLNDTIISNSHLTLSEIEFLTSDTNMEGIGIAVKDIEAEKGINAFVTIAIAKLESGSGTSKIARLKNNLFGLNAIDGDAFNKALSFRTLDECVYKFGDIMEDHYFDHNLKSLATISKKYCTSDAWARKVMAIVKDDYRKLKR